MIVRSLEEIAGSDRDVSGPGWESRRLLLASDGMGYSLNDTVIQEDASLTLEYKHHLEACYCIEGEGNITALADGVTHHLQPFTVYALDRNDRHTVRATKGDMRLVCVFTPALTGREVHREDGSYARP
ncbi:MAG: ectoine synthase [Pseudomonadota bacterium]